MLGHATTALTLNTYSHVLPNMQDSAAGKQKDATKPEGAKNKPTTSESEKDDEGWGPVGDAAKKVAKGAVKGAAKEVLKK